jgi:hypothetical protein
VELQGHTDCPSTFDEFLNVDKSVPATTDQQASLDGPGPSCKLMVVEEEKTEKKSGPATCYGGSLDDGRYSSYSFLTLALEGGEWSPSHPGHALPLGKEPLVPIV